MSETSFGIWKSTAPSAPSLPCVRSLNQDDKANSDMYCGDLFPHGFQASPTPLLPMLRVAGPGVGSQLSWKLGILGNGRHPLQ